MPTRPDGRTLIDLGRDTLLQWEAAKPKNFFTADQDQQLRLQMYLGDEAYACWQPRYEGFGEVCATELNAAAIENNRDENLPTLRRYSNLGVRIEQVVHHPLYHRIADLIWETGLMADYATPGQEVAQMGLYYLVCQNGEAGHNCPLACTAGLIKVLQAVGERQLQDRWLPGLLSTVPGEYLRGAQFLTEIQGGSDVGANATRATQTEDGTWRIDGEKWFCSVADADLYLVTARADAKKPGTEGLGMFLVPRLLADGTVNGVHLRRLKYKLGTRSMASAEMDFVGAVAYPIGPIAGAFRNTMKYVITTSRLYNAIASTGMMRRAQIEAASYAQHRTAFDHVIAQYPLVQESLAKLKTETQANTASTFYLFDLADKVARGEADAVDKATFRVGVNINKYRTSVQTTLMIHEAMEVLAGNGAIEDFSVLPRLLRDSIVCEMWEGTHNVLAQQVLRDMQRYRVHEGFFECMEETLHEIDGQQVSELKMVARDRLDRARTRVHRVLTGDMQFGSRYIRCAIDDMAILLQSACLLSELQWQREEGITTDKADVIAHFLQMHAVPAVDPMDDRGVLGRAERLAQTY